MKLGITSVAREPLVSIILCTYNRAHLLPDAIRSVLRQTYSRWELIVIDDGSIDDTRSLVENFQRKDKRILYHFQTNKGLAAARNAGLRRAKGLFIGFVDSDDEWTPAHVSLRVKYLRKHPAVDFLHGGMRLIGPKHKQYVVDMTDRKRKIHLRRCHIGGTFFFRNIVMKKTGGFRKIPFGEDFDFYERTARHFTVRKVGFPTYRYHLDSENRLCDLFTEKLFIS